MLTSIYPKISLFELFLGSANTATNSSDASDKSYLDL